MFTTGLHGSKRGAMDVPEIGTGGLARRTAGVDEFTASASCGKPCKPSLQGLFIFTVLAAVLLLAAGCAQKPDKKPPPRPIRVGTLPVDRGAIRHWVKASGPLKFLANTVVSSEVSSQVKTILVTDGQAVNQGDVLLVFDDTKIRENAVHAGSNLQKNQAILAYRKVEWEKNRKLFESGTVSHTMYEQKVSEYQEIAAQVEADRAMLARAMDDLKKTRVKAPVSGRISRRYVEKGDWVSESGKLFQVSDFSKVYLQAYVSDTDVAKLDVKKVLNKGVEAQVSVDSYPNEIFKGKLSFIDPSANEANLFEIRIYVENRDMRLLQGMFARGGVVHNDTEGVVRVPIVALMDQVRTYQPNRVFVAGKDGKAHRRTVRVGTVNDTYAEVLKGLEVGDAVIVRGKDVIGDDQPVAAKEMQQSE